MKKILSLIIFILFLVSFGFTQTLSKSEKTKISELMQDIEEAEDDKKFDVVYDKYIEIATIYSDISTSDAEENYNLAFQKAKNSKDKMVVKNLIGTMYENQKDYSKAATFYLDALRYAKETGNEEKFVLNSYITVGYIYESNDQNSTAINYFNEALKLGLKYKNSKQVSRVLNEISKCYKKDGNNDGATKYKNLANMSLEKIEAEISFNKKQNVEKNREIDALINSLSKIGSENIGLKESLTKQINDIKQLQNSLQKLNDTLAHQELALKKVKENLNSKTQELSKVENYLRKRDVALTAAIAIILLITILAILTLRGYFIKKKQHKLLEEQKKIIAAKNEDITGSIRYAKRIQKAILPTESDLKIHFPDSFVILQPKDIVSGDFYWIAEQNDKIIIAAADCTGHGVPGAFMSVLGITYFDEIVNKSYITDSDLIINKLRESIIKSFHVHESASQTKDGMDLALIVVDKNMKKLSYSGAYNPLILIREGEVFVYKADRIPVGFHDKVNHLFTKTEIDLKSGDAIYMFSDGFLDQFGGKHGRKFLLNRLKELLLKIYYKPMNDQKEVLDNAFNLWKGNYEQVDDVLLMGIKIK